jgi:phosphate transport system substrate-binding protein
MAVAVVTATILAWTGCGGGGRQAQRLNGAGSSFVYPIMSKWANEYAKAKGVRVNYLSIASGAGIRQMIEKTVDFGCTDAPMNDEQLAKALKTGGKVVHIPLVMGAVVPIYNLQGQRAPLRFSGTVLADIYLSKITKWNDPELAKLNPGVELPDLDILVVHRSDGSGTTYIWVDYLSKISTAWENRVGVGTSVNWPGGLAAKGNEGVAGKVSQSAGALGYVELIYARQNKIEFGAVQNREGEFVKPSLESVTAAATNALKAIPDDLRYSLTDASGKNAYPISGTVWAVIYVDQPPGKGQAVVEFLRWMTHEGQDYAQALDYARLPEELIKRLEKKLDQVHIGANGETAK